jgi:lipoprotein signal peptidase
LPNDTTSQSGPKPADGVAPTGGPRATRGVPVDAAGTALCDVGSHVRLWSVVALGLAADLWSKEWAFRTLRQGGQRTLIPHVLELHTTMNPGALFGIGAGRTSVFLVASVLALILVLWMFAQSPPRRWFMHIALGAILAGALGNMYDRVFVQLVPYSVSAPGVGAGRYYVERESADGRSIQLQEYPPDDASPVYTLPRPAEGPGPQPVGYVRDFIKIPTRWWGGRELWPWVFNVADMLLVGGVAILAIRMLRDRKPEASPADVELDASVGKP